jgi:hypothetical protein
MNFNNEIDIVPALHCARNRVLVEVKDCMECSYSVNRTQIVANGGFTYGKVYCKFWPEEVKKGDKKVFRAQYGLSPLLQCVPDLKRGEK